MINDLRKKKMKLRPVAYLSCSQGSQSSESDVPYAYIWSPHLVPKPKGGCLDALFCYKCLPFNLSIRTGLAVIGRSNFQAIVTSCFQIGDQKWMW